MLANRSYKSKPRDCSDLWTIFANLYSTSSVNTGTFLTNCLFESIFGLPELVFTVLQSLIHMASREILSDHITQISSMAYSKQKTKISKCPHNPSYLGLHFLSNFISFYSTLCLLCPPRILSAPWILQAHFYLTAFSIWLFPLLITLISQMYSLFSPIFTLCYFLSLISPIKPLLIT